MSNARTRNQERQRRYDKNKRDLTIIKVVAGVVAVGIIAAIAVSIWNWGQDRELNRRPEGVVAYPYAGNQHRDGDVAYPQETDYQGEIPPVGGTHNNAWMQCGTYDVPIRWENAVHAIEHGAVWVTYRPDLPADQIERLRELGDEEEVLVSPEPLLRSPIVLSVWGNQLSLDTYDDTTVKRFIRFFKNNPDAAPEAGANCATGVTTGRTTEPATPVDPAAAAPTATVPTAVETPTAVVASPASASPAAGSPTAATPAASPSPTT